MFFMVSDLECSTLISATNIFYVSGSTDPWHSLAVVKDPVAGSKGILIEGADHIDFMFLHGYNDEVNKRVNDTREQIKELLAKALGKKLYSLIKSLLTSWTGIESGWPSTSQTGWPSTPPPGWPSPSW